MDEKIYSRIAKDYARHYEAELKRELDALENGPPMVTPGLDRRVASRISDLKRADGTRRKLWGLIAACFALILLVPYAVRTPDIGNPPPQYSDTAPGAETPGPAEEPDAQPVSPPAYEILPLSFSLPERFTLAGFEQDVAKTVYYLEDSKRDNVVMTLERSEDAEDFEKNALVPLVINGHEAYGSTGNGYSLLTFEKQGIVYVLTCRHDINTLLSLGGIIL